MKIDKLRNFILIKGIIKTIFKDEFQGRKEEEQ